MVDWLAGQTTLTALSHTCPPFASRLTNSSQTPWITSVSTEQIHYKACPKKCYFHSPLETFWLTMMSSAKAETCTNNTLHCMKMHKNESKINHWRLLNVKIVFNFFAEEVVKIWNSDEKFFEIKLWQKTWSMLAQMVELS